MLWNCCNLTLYLTRLVGLLIRAAPFNLLAHLPVNQNPSHLAVHLGAVQNLDNIVKTAIFRL